MKYLFIDIRQSDEVLTKRFGESSQYGSYNIPMNMIRFNKEMIVDHLAYVDKIYIVCRSGTRSEFIKDKYFNDNPNIKVNESLQFKNLKHGINNVELDGNVINVNVIGSSSYNMYNMMRIIQTIIGSLIIILGGYTYYQVKDIKSVNKIPLIVLLCFGVMALINGLTATCTMSIILRDYIN
jgi:hypothetical protein